MKKPTCVDTFVLKKRNLHNDYFALTLSSYPRARDCHPGHFVHVKIPSTNILFRRAMSVAGISAVDNEINIIFKVFGRGTRLMSDLHRGDPVNLLGPLGKPFSLPKQDERILLVAGGVGFPPLLFLAERLIEKGFDSKRIEFFYGGRSSVDILMRSRIKRLGVHFHAVTEDGSLGRGGLVTLPVTEFIEAHRRDKLRLYGCGPEPMLKAVNDLGMQYGVQGEISLEAPMPCGIGVCLGCVVPRVDGGHSRVCLEGPVFDIGEIAL